MRREPEQPNQYGDIGVGWKIYEFDYQDRKEIFLFSKLCRQVMWPTQPPVRWIPGVLLSEVKWLRHEVYHPALSMAKVKNEWSYTSALPTSSCYAQGQFYHFSYLCVSACSGTVLTDKVQMPYSLYETDIKKIPFIANRFTVRFEVSTVVETCIISLWSSRL